jgi:hypothetical protein
MKPGAGVVLDSGFFIALERRSRIVVALADLMVREGTPLVTSAGVVAQVWRGGGKRQAPLAFMIRRVVVVALDFAVARTLGRMLGLTRTSDPVDAHVVLLARERGWPVLTSDAADLLALDPALRVERV